MYLDVRGNTFKLRETPEYLKQFKYINLLTNINKMETWKPIKDFEHTKYLISNYGNVKNKDTNYILEKHDKTGYSTVLLTHEGKSTTHRLHVLVAKTFLDNDNPKNIVNHKDGNKLNNKLDNLEYISQSENMIHAVKHKLLNPKHRILDINDVINDTDEFNKLVSKKITDFPTYSITTDGRIFSHKTGIFLKCCTNPEGYIRITLRNVHHEKKYLLHRLVALAFIPNPENKEQVNHKDMNKSNNSVENLEWITNRENKIHSLNNYRVTNIISFPYDFKQTNKNILKAQIEITMLKKAIAKDSEEVSNFMKLLDTKLI